MSPCFCNALIVVYFFFLAGSRALFCSKAVVWQSMITSPGPLSPEILVAKYLLLIFSMTVLCTKKFPKNLPSHFTSKIKYFKSWSSNFDAEISIFNFKHFTRFLDQYQAWLCYKYTFICSIFEQFRKKILSWSQKVGELS